MIPVAINNGIALAQPPLALYIHFPWCVRKCPYCDFNSHELKTEVPEREYIHALLAELDNQLPAIWGRSILSIFMGGGTPSLFSAAALDELFSQLRARLKLLPSIEITLEANPGTVEQEKFRDFRAIGINRLSIGVQSFNPRHLTALGRIHDQHQAAHAADMAHAAGFDNFNLDLMYGLPGQTIDEAQADIAQAIALQPSHISYYQLTLEPNTTFANQPPPLPVDDTIADIEAVTRRTLTAAGYQHYETSAFARATHQCVHNINYWQFGDYLGLGAGAHSKLTHVAQQQITRHWNCKHPRDYMTQAGTAQCIAGTQLLTSADLVLEFMMNSLRLHDGFAPHSFSERTGLSLTSIHPALQRAVDRGLLEWAAHQIKPSEHGRRFLNDLLAVFVPDPHSRR
jgi:oxygen-independent coproporphyrinogen-3 oxidase